MNFSDLNLHSALNRAVKAEGYVQPTPIQELAIPHVLNGRDVLGCAQTGTGKTAAFALPVLHRMLNEPQKGKRRYIRVLALAPTRELAIQIGSSFSAYSKFTDLCGTVIYGGVNQNPQVKALQRGIDILVATPGRLLDLIGQGYVNLGRVETFILDEADRMLDMGFIHDIKQIAQRIPTKRQTLLFSATVAPRIQELATEMLDRPEEVSTAPSATTVEGIEQSIVMVERPGKIDLLIRLIQRENIGRTLVFSRTKHGADKIVHKLSKASISASAIHGNKSQNNRQAALAAFKRGKVHVLVATDIASRGLDIDDVTHVINFDIPHEPEAYVHRIGRTGRAGAHGIAISFCSAEERKDLHSIQSLINQRLPIHAGSGQEVGHIEEAPAFTPLEIRKPAKRSGQNSTGSARRRSRRHRRKPVSVRP